MKDLGGRHAEGFDVRRYVAHGRQEAVVEGVELVGPVSHEFVDDYVEQVRVVAGERREIDRQLFVKRRVEIHAKVALARQEQQNECTYMNEADLGGVFASLVHEV